MLNSIIKRLLLLCIFSFTLWVSNAQTLYSCNGNYKIELPNKLELQHSELNNIRKTVDRYKKTQISVTSQTGNIIFQQTGLNADVKSAYNKYCRVIIEYFKESINDPTFGRGDKVIIDKDLLYAVTESSKESCSRSGTPFIKLITIQPMTINGLPVLYYSYKRKGWEGKQPPVIVNVYQIYNRYEWVNLTFSYREAERNNWNVIHEYIIKTFKFNRIY